MLIDWSTRTCSAKYVRIYAAGNKGRSSVNKLAVADDGTVYLLVSNQVFAVSPKGSVTKIVGDLFGPVDIEVDGNGVLRVVHSTDLITTVDSAGEVHTEKAGLHGAMTFKTLPDGRVVFGSTTGIYERTTEDELRQLVGQGLSSPKGVAFDSAGDLLIADAGQGAIMRLTQGVVEPFVTGFEKPYGLAIDEADVLYVTDFASNALFRVTPEGEVSTLATGLDGPYDVKLTASGSAIVSNYNGDSVVAVAPDGAVSELIGPSLNYPLAVATDAAGNTYIANRTAQDIIKIATDGTVSHLADISGLIVSLRHAGTGLEVLSRTGTLTHIDPSGKQIVLASDLGYVDGFTSSGDGGWFVSQANRQRIVHLGAAGTVTPYVERHFQLPRSVRALDNGAFILAANDALARVEVDGTVHALASGLKNATGIALDEAGNVYTAEQNANRILKLSPTGEMSSIPVAFTPGGIALARDGSLLVGHWGGTLIARLAPDGSWSDYARTDHRIYYDLYMDATETLWASHYHERRVSRIAPDGSTQVFLLDTSYPASFAADGTGGVYVAGYGEVAHIRADGTIGKLDLPGLTVKRLAGVVPQASGGFAAVDFNGEVARFDTTGRLLERRVGLTNPNSLVQTPAGILVTTLRGVVQIDEPKKLGRIVADGVYSDIAAEADGSYLLGRSGAVVRLARDLSGSEIVASGFRRLEGIAPASHGTFVAVDSVYNRLSQHGRDGSLVETTFGLVHPKGVAITASGKLLVANASPSAIMEVSPNGKLDVFAGGWSANYLWSEPDGSVSASLPGQIRRFSATGDPGEYIQATSPTGLARDGKGLLYAGSSQAAVNRYDSVGEVKVASGLALPSDIVTDRAGNMYVADSRRGVVNRVHADGTLSLYAAHVPGAGNLTFDSRNRLYVPYSGKLARFDTDGTRTPIPLALAGRLAGIAATPADEFFAATQSPKTVARLTFTGGAPIPAGETVYVQSTGSPSLQIDGIPAVLDFGSWVPEVAGDYLVEVTLDDGATQGSLTNTLHPVSR